MTDQRNDNDNGEPAAAVVVGDSGESEALARAEYARSLEALLEISHAVGSVMELHDVLRRIVVETARVMGADVCSVFLFDSDRKQLLLRSAHGLRPGSVNHAAMDGSEGVAGWVARTGEILALPDAQTDPRFQPIPGTGEEDLRALLCAPLRIQNEVIGVMVAGSKTVHGFDPAVILLFETVCKQVAIVIEKARLYFEKRDAERLAAIAVGLSEIAHYIKNLLQSVEGASFVIEKALRSEDIGRVRQGWDLLKRNNKKITDLVANMLSYSRQEEPILAEGNVNQLLRDVVEAAQLRAERHEVQLAESYDPNLPNSAFDEDYLRDAFLNLVANAIDAIPQTGGVVEVRTKSLPDESRVLVEVADTGAGIPTDIQDKVFNLFFSTKGPKGTGIGLAATKKRIEAHNGEIGFVSRPGKGTTFRVRLPVHATPKEILG